MPLGSFSKDKLVFDPTEPLESDNIGAYVRAGNDGTQISWTANVNVPASLILQDLTYTAACTDFDAGNSITIAYTAGGTAGSEVVTVVGPAISVSIDTAVSTATQIKAAIDASLAAQELVSVSISGVGATAQVAVGATSLAGGTLKQALDVHNMGSPHNGQFHEDCQHTSGDKGQFILGVRHDADTSMVSHDGDYAPLQLDANGNLKVIADLDVDFDYVYAEDAPSADGNLGAYVLTVRQDVPASTTNLDGDFQSFKTDSVGRLWVNANINGMSMVPDDDPDSGDPLKVGSRSEWGALAALSAANDRADLISDKYRRVYVNNGSNIAIRAAAIIAGVAQVEAKSGASRLEGRRLLMFQNLSNKECYIGETGVSSTSGIVLAARASMSLDVGQDVAVFVLGSAAGLNVRVMEMA